MTERKKAGHTDGVPRWALGWDNHRRWHRTSRLDVHEALFYLLHVSCPEVYFGGELVSQGSLTPLCWNTRSAQRTRPLLRRSLGAECRLEGREAGQRIQLGQLSQPHGPRHNAAIHAGLVSEGLLQVNLNCKEKQKRVSFNHKVLILLVLCLTWASVDQVNQCLWTTSGG